MSIHSSQINPDHSQTDPRSSQANPASSQTGLLDDRWVKAAVVGGLWASFEIVIGSFLHNLHVPFSGSILTFIATLFIISFYRMWPVRGLVWRAGLICALMKSVSPSAVIIGPMTGIFMEALFIDLVLRSGGNRLPVILLAGAASQLSALLHKAGSILILYGWDIVRIYENIFDYTLRQFNNLEMSPVSALICLILIYTFAGMLASFLGYRLGVKIPSRAVGIEGPRKPLRKNRHWDVVDPAQRFSTPMLILHLAVLPMLLFLFERTGLHPLTLSLFAGYIIFDLLWYSRIKYRLLKPVFWLHLLIIAVMAGLFWHPDESVGPAATQWDGWIVGLMLNLRAILVITGFSALSTELRNPQLKVFLFRFGFRKVYHAVSMAFSALPLMMERGARGRDFLFHPVKSIRQLLLDANGWFYVLQQDQNSELEKSEIK